MKRSIFRNSWFWNFGVTCFAELGCFLAVPSADNARWIVFGLFAIYSLLWVGVIVNHIVGSDQ